MTDRDTTVSYTYDALGRKLAETRTLGDTPYTLSYSYDIAGVLMSITYPDG